MIAPLHILALGFLTPWLMAAGAAATSIPIVIHLLNKRKFRIVIWAAMEWLLAAQRRNARRLRFQRWLLLALRCLAILVIAAGIAEMFLQSRAVATFLGEQRAVVIIWDDSYSMGYQQGQGNGGAGTAFEQSKRFISDSIGQLRSGDRVLVIRASVGGPDVPEATAGKPTADHQAVISMVQRTRLSDAATDLPAAFDRARQALTELESTTRWRQLLVVTDLSASSIRDPARPDRAGADAAIVGTDGQRLRQAAQGAVAHATDLRIVDVGVEDQSSLAVTALSTRRPAVVVGVPTELVIEVFNATARTQLDVPVNILVDGVPVRSVRIPRLEAASFNTQAVTAEVTLPTTGRHLVEARLPGDLLAADDVRRLMLNVRKEIPVLLVDGSPGEGGMSGKGSTLYLFAAYALSAQDFQGSMFAPRTISELELPTTPLAGYDVVVLSETAPPAAAQRQALESFVEEGGLLIIFPGNRTNAQAMNEVLGENGARLLPAALGQPVRLETARQIEQGIKFAPQEYRHAVLEVFARDISQGRNVGLDLVQITQYLKLAVPVDGSVETILRFAAADGTPGDAAVVKKDFGKGRVVLFATTASASENGWNNWGAKPSFLPFIHELTHYSMARQSVSAGAGLTLNVGVPMRLPADAASAGPWIGPRDSHVTVTQELDNRQRAWLTSAPLTMAGTYAPGAGDQRPAVAVNADPREADIRHVGHAQLAGALGIPQDAIITGAPPAALLSDARGADAASWLGPVLVAVALGIFILEALLALAFSTYR